MIHPSEIQDPTMRKPWGTPMHILLRAEYPIALVAGLALSAAGAGMQMAGASKAKSAMNDAQAGELLRQKKFQGEADAAFQQNLYKSKRDTAETEQTAGADRRTNEYAKLEATGAGVSAPIATTASGSANPNSAAGAASRNRSVVQASGNAWSKLVGNARARLGGGDDWQLNQAIRNNRTGQDLAITSSNARSSAAILPYEMQDASHAGDALKGWGQLVGALGAVTGMAGAVTGSAPSAATQAAAASAANSGYVPVGAMATRMAQPAWAALGALP